MKKILTIAVASIAVAAAADTYSPSIGVTSISLSQKNNVIPVQFNSLATSGNVTANELVCTNNIPLESHLYVYDNGYTAWKLESTGWVAANTVSTSEGITISPGAAEKSLSAGSAIWLSFPETPGSAINVSFYGKVAASTNTTIAAGTDSAPVSTLVCNPTGATISGSDLAAKLSFVQPKDKIIPLNSTFGGYYSYSSKYSCWKKVIGTTVDKESVGLPDVEANGGFWYVREKGNTTDGSIVW